MYSHRYCCISTFILVGNVAGPDQVFWFRTLDSYLKDINIYIWTHIWEYFTFLLLWAKKDKNESGITHTLDNSNSKLLLWFYAGHFHILLQNWKTFHPYYQNSRSEIGKYKCGQLGKVSNNIGGLGVSCEFWSGYSSDTINNVVALVGHLDTPVPSELAE